MSEYKMLFGFATMDFNENIATVIDDSNPEYYVVKKPYTLLKRPVGDGEMSIAFMPFMMSAGVGEGESVRITRSQIAWSIVEPNIDENLVNNYYTQTTGLALPAVKAPSKLLVK